MDMDEIKGSKADPTPGQDSPKGNESNSTTTPNYTEEQYRKGIEDAIAQYGDKVKREKIDPIATERDTFKNEVAQLRFDAEDATTSREESEKRISGLEADLEVATEDNVDLRKIQEIKRELRTERDTARQERRTERQANADLKRTLEAERLEWAETVTEAQAAQFEVNVFEIAEEYEGGNSDRLKALCEKAGQKKRGDIRELADMLWAKKGKAPVLVGDSGVTTGSGGAITREVLERRRGDPDFRQWFAENEKEIDKLYKEGRL